MLKIRFWTVLLITVVGFGASAAGGELTITVRGLRDHVGELRIAVYAATDRDTFPDSDRGMAVGVRIRLASIVEADEQLVVSVGALPPGRYAVSAFHDANSDGILNRNLVGMPAEGRGFSRRARTRFGPPSFDDAAFEVSDDQEARAQITLAY